MINLIRNVLDHIATRRRHAAQMTIAERVMSRRRGLLARLARGGNQP